MTVHIYKEAVLTGGAEGAAFDHTHGDIFFLQGFKGIEECAALVLEDETDGAFVIAAGRGGMFADDQEAGRVHGVIFDMFCNDVQAGHFDCGISCDGCTFGAVDGGFDGGDTAGTLNCEGVGKFFGEEFAALTEDLGVAVNNFDFGEVKI